MNGDNQATAVKRNKDASFWKTNSDTVIKMLVHQFGLTVFGFLLNSAASVSGNDLLVIGLGLFSAVFYLFLLYVVAWELGAKDKIRIDGGRMKRDIFKGAKINLVANIPNLIVATLALVGFLFIDKSIMTEGAYTDPAWAVNLRGIAQLVGNFLNAMYLGIGQYFNVLSSVWFLYAVCAPSIIVCGAGYCLGTHEICGVFASSGNGQSK